MNTGHLPVSESAARRAPKSRARKAATRGRSSKNGAHHSHGEAPLAAHGSLTRTKALLLAALRVWELKHRIGD